MLHRKLYQWGSAFACFGLIFSWSSPTPSPTGLEKRCPYHQLKYSVLQFVYESDCFYRRLPYTFVVMLILDCVVGLADLRSRCQSCFRISVIVILLIYLPAVAGGRPDHRICFELFFILRWKASRICIVTLTFLSLLIFLQD